MAAIKNIEKYNLSNFNSELALTGILLFAKVFGEEIYYLITEFQRNDTSHCVTCKYMGLVEDQLVYFDDNGDSANTSVSYSIKMVTSLINTEIGGMRGSTITTRGTGGEEQNFTLTTLNYRETIAKEVLGFLINSMKNPEGLSDAKITYLINAAFRYSFEFVNQALDIRNDNAEIEQQQEESAADPTAAMDENTFWNLQLQHLFNIRKTITPASDEIVAGGENIVAKLEALKRLYADYVKHTPTQGEPETKTTVGLDDLIAAIKSIEGGGGSGGGGDVNIKEIPSVTIESIESLPNNLGNINVGNEGLGRDAEHPIYINGGGFPSRSVLAAAFTEAVIHDFLTFNEAGAVGYSTKTEVKKAILGFLNSYTDIIALSEAVYNNIDIIALSEAVYNNIYQNIQNQASKISMIITLANSNNASNTVKTTNLEWKYVLVDSEEKILAGISQNGDCSIFASTEEILNCIYNSWEN